MKALMTATSFKLSYGGPAVSVARLASALREVGVNVTVWSADGSEPNAEYGSGPFWRADLQTALDPKSGFDVVHDNGLWLRHNHVIATLARKHALPRVVSCRGMLQPWARRHKRYKKEIAWFLYQRRDVATAAVLHATSDDERYNLMALGLKPRVISVGNGVDAAAAENVDAAWAKKCSTSRASFREAVFVGRIHRVKGLEPWLDAWAKVRPSGWRMTIAGPDEDGYLASLEDRVKRLHLQDDVRFIGPVAGVQKTELLLGADLFILPSFQESFGLAAAEAMAHGVPTIVTTGAPWAQEAAHGLVWRVPCDADSLAGALRDAVAQTDAQRRCLGFAARKRVSDSFGWHSVAEAIAMTYRQVADTKRTKCPLPESS